MTRMEMRPRKPAPQRELSCPGCDAAITVSERELVDGQTVRCSHCGAEPELMREWDEHSDAYHWILFDPDRQADDGR